MTALQLLCLPSIERGEFALRLAIAAALTTYLVMYFQTPEPALTAYLVFFMNKPDRVTSILTQLIMIALITIVIGGILFMATWVIDSPFWRVISMVGLSIALLFLGSASKLKPIAATLALITGYSLDLLGSAPVGEAAVRGLLYAWLFVAIPVAASVVVNLLIAPAPVSFARRKIEQRLSVAEDYLADINPEAQEEISKLLLEGNEEINKWLKLTGLEHSISGAESDKLRRLSVISYEILTFLSIHSTVAITPRVRIPLKALITELRSQLKSKQPLRSIILPSELQRMAEDEELGSFAKGLTCSLTEFNLPSRQSDHLRETTAPSGFFLPDAFTNPVHIHYALRTTGAAMSCYFLYNLMDWPGIHTCFITCYIVSLGTAAESLSKLRLRIVGCLMGAALGVSVMIELIPYATSIDSLIWIVFTGTLLAGWVSAGNARISYAGFQIAFAFYLCVLQGPSPEFDLSIARDRVIGILLGNFVAYIFITELWPISIGGRVDIRLLDFFKSLLMLKGGSSSDFYSKASKVRADLALARIEPAGIRPELEEIRLREVMVDTGLEVAADILSYRKHTSECPPALERFHRNLALRLAGQSMNSSDVPEFDQILTINLPSLRKLDELSKKIQPLIQSESHA
jgi:multidrug resistance protein MdtO